MPQLPPVAVVILAAGSIKNKYSSYSFIYNSPALVPIASRSTISFILDFYTQHDAVIYIAVNASDEALFRSELVYYSNVKLLPIASSIGVCDTLAQAIASVQEETVIVNLATTIPTSFPAINSVVTDVNLSDHNYYSGIIFSSNGPRFKSKNDEGSEPFNAFTGVFATSKQQLDAVLPALRKSTDLLDVVRKINERAELTFTNTDWIDTGHEINYADARRKLISSRSFNAISVDKYSGILSKQSRNIDKLMQETRYVGMLPTDLQILYPRLLSEDSKVGLVRMEYYGYPNLSEYQLYRALEPSWWARIFDVLTYSLQAMANHPFSIGPSAFEQFYFEKTFNRVDSFLADLPVDDIFNTASSLSVNGATCLNIQNLKEPIANKIKAMYNEADFCVMHGDFCFNNILFDTVSNTIKLIDPRGSFGEHCVGIYGDRKYDLAKLMHSTVGHYDYIVNNLFSIEQSGDAFTYSFPLRDNMAVLERLSYEMLEELNVNRNDILFIVGLLFLSMCPLHKDNKQRQRLMYVHGLYFVNKYL